MIKEGEESYTTNLCQPCHNESLVARGDSGEKDASWKVMENDGNRTVHTRNVGILSPRKIKSKKNREEAEKERQAGTQLK